MKRLAIATSILALAAPLALAQTSAWVPDPAHSEVDFTIRHGGVSNVHGRFGGVKGTLVYNEADVTKSTVTVTIDTATVNTGEPKRDDHLKTDAFFDVVKFPTAAFTSSSVSKNGSRLTVNGNLTLHGVTKPVVLDVDGPSTPVEGMMDHKAHSGFSATTTISRTAFGIGSNFPAIMVGDEVKLTIDIEIIKQ
ncbi:MAG: YceI family protein [Terracidiphilus sp.]|jgi:polyisoprenoid-binding protein YceI